jgi:hypothetical protein
MHKSVVPAISKAIRDEKNKIQKDIQFTKKRSDQLNIRNLRGAANKYVQYFIHTLEKLLEGSEKYYAPLEGQTLLEEKTDQGMMNIGLAINISARFTWKLPPGQLNEINTEDWNDEISMGSSKLNGGHQFKRLLVEFKTVVEQLSLSSG